MNLFRKLYKKMDERLPRSYMLGTQNFLTVDTRGRIVIEDCDKIISFTDMLLVVAQGRMTLTFVGEGLNLQNLSRHSARLCGRVESIRIDKGER